MGKRKGDERQLSLLGLLDGTEQPVVAQQTLVEAPIPAQPAVSAGPIMPRWIDPYPGLPHTDFMEPHADLIAFLYPWRNLNALFGEDSLHGPWSVQRALLRGLIALGEARSKRLRERAFTIYMGDVGGGHSIFCVALGSTDARLTEFMHPHLAVPGFETLEGGLNGFPGTMLPAWARYDHGHIIRYEEPSMAGTSAIDDEEYGLGTGALVHYRDVWDGDDYGFPRGAWAKLKPTGG